MPRYLTPRLVPPGVFYRRGIIETWGRGALKIRELCAEANLPEPEFRADMHSFTVCFRPRTATEEQVTPQVTPQVARVLEAACSTSSFSQLLDAAGLRDRVHFLKTYLEPLLAAGWLERTIPEKPRSSKQKSRLTEKGRQLLDSLG